MHYVYTYDVIQQDVTLIIKLINSVGDNLMIADLPAKVINRLLVISLEYLEVTNQENRYMWSIR